MGLLAGLQKNIKAHHVIAIIGVVVLIFAIMQYSRQKYNVSDSFGSGGSGYASGYASGSGSGSGSGYSQNSDNAQPANPAGQNEEYASVSGITTTSYGLPPTCSRGGNSDPADLLPKDTNSQWAQLNPAGGADFKNVNLLKAGYHIGIDTIGSSLRNANLQERSEPPNPTSMVSPWMNSTIEPDLMRAPLEIGCGKQ